MALKECETTPTLKGVNLAIRLARAEQLLKTAGTIPIPEIVEHSRKRVQQLTRMALSDEVAQRTIGAARVYLHSVSKREAEFQKSFLGQTMTVLEEVLALRYPDHSATEEILLEEHTGKEHFSLLEKEFRIGMRDGDQEKILKALWSMLIVGKAEVIYLQHMPPLDGKFALDCIARWPKNDTRKQK